MQPLIFVTYDGVENSVFNGQVIAPLLRHHQEHPHQPIHLISFERAHVSVAALEQLPLTVHLLKRLPFVGMLSMWHSIYLLRKVLKQFPTYELVSRGPLAGYICLKAVRPRRCRSLTVQARGLLAEEYRYAHASSRGRSFIHRLWHAWRARGLEKIERAVYGTKWTVAGTIEAVSLALKRHLITTYRTSESSITVAHKDVPALIPEAQRMTWRREVRRELNIPDDALVYCYNGSVKAWQCPEETVVFFKRRVERRPASFLLVLTMDTEPFLQLLKKMSVPENAYRVLTVAHQDIYRYLAAADTGIIFRKPSVVNWVSRPTKALEYRAVGLKIVHNNTVEMLKQ